MACLPLVKLGLVDRLEKQELALLSHLNAMHAHKLMILGVIPLYQQYDKCVLSIFS